MQVAFEAGADDYIIKPVDRFDLLSRVRLHLRLKDALALAAEGVSSEERQTLADTQDVAVFTLAKLAETRDNETGAHFARMRESSLSLARDLGQNSRYGDQIDDQFLQDLARSAPLHDIGKVGIPDDILLKPGPLSVSEFEVMKRHTTIGANILDQALTQTTAASFLTMAAMIARFHHERWDGEGYPLGLAGHSIPLAARIVAVADVYDALTSERPYKRAWPREQAERFILDHTGTQFDPEIVASFSRCFDEIVSIGQDFGDDLPYGAEPAARRPVALAPLG